MVRRKDLDTITQWIGSEGANVPNPVLQALSNIEVEEAVWSGSPTGPGLWWWWNGDPNASPIDVRLDFANGPEEPLYALAGQHGWNRFQKVTDMKGYWTPCVAPFVPHALRMKHAGGADV